MTYHEINELTFPQVRCLLNGGEEPVGRIDDPDDMRDLIRQVQSIG